MKIKVLKLVPGERRGKKVFERPLHPLRPEWKCSSSSSYLRPRPPEGYEDVLS